MKESPRPLVEVLVEGELSPFEHEALYQLLRKRFRLEHPSYVELPDEDLATRINIAFHHPYTLEFFRGTMQESWRDLKVLMKEIRYRRGRAGAAFNFTFINNDSRLTFRSGLLDDEEMGSAMDQIGHLTGIVGRMTAPETMKVTLSLIESTFDKKSDRWHEFKGFHVSAEEHKSSYRFNETAFQWVSLE